MKRISFVIAVMVFAVALTGCVSREQREKNRNNQLRAEKNAVEYIENKYGFTADVTNSDVESYGGLFGPTFSGYVYVEMEYEGKDFTVCINGETENTDGKDNYQEDEITAYIKDSLFNLAKIKCDDVFVQNHYYCKEASSDEGSDDNYFLLYNTYFNGDNLDELLDERQFQCYASCFDEDDLSKLDAETMESIFKTSSACIFSYKEDTPSSILKSNALRGSSYYKYKYAMYIHQEILYKCGSNDYEYFKPAVQTFGEFSYITEDTEPLEFKVMPSEPAENWNGRGAINAQICSQAYSLPMSDKSVWVYFDKNKLPENGENCSIALSWIDNYGKRNHVSGPQTYDAGDYIVRQIRPDRRGYYFVVIHDEK